MITKKEFFKEVYFIDNPECLTNRQWDYLLMSGRENWDKYFVPFKTKKDYEVLENISLVEFDTEKAMFSYIKKLKSNNLINFSLDHENPCLLRFV